MIIYSVCKVICWQAICFNNNYILIIFRKFYIAFNNIVMSYFSFFVSHGFKTNNIWLSRFNFFCRFFHC